MAEPIDILPGYFIKQQRLTSYVPPHGDLPTKKAPQQRQAAFREERDIGFRGR
jgi:hypothetical protein